MSNIDKQALIAKIKKQTESFDTVVLKEDEANALLDELEAKDNRINRLEAIVAVAEQRNALMREWKRALKVPCDLVDDQVPVVIHGMVIRLDRLKETEAKLEAEEKRIAELEAVKCKLSDSKLLSLAKDIVENLVDTGSSEPEYTQQYVDWTFKRIRAAAAKGEAS